MLPLRKIPFTIILDLPPYLLQLPIISVPLLAMDRMVRRSPISTLLGLIVIFCPILEQFWFTAYFCQGFLFLGLGRSQQILYSIVPLSLYFQQPSFYFDVHLLLYHIDMGLQLEQPLLHAMIPSIILVNLVPTSFPTQDGVNFPLDLLNPSHHILFPPLLFLKFTHLTLLLLMPNTSNPSICGLPSCKFSLPSLSNDGDYGGLSSLLCIFSNALVNGIACPHPMWHLETSGCLSSLLYDSMGLYGTAAVRSDPRAAFKYSNDNYNSLLQMYITPQQISFLSVASEIKEKDHIKHRDSSSFFSYFWNYFQELSMKKMEWVGLSIFYYLALQCFLCSIFSSLFGLSSKVNDNLYHIQQMFVLMKQKIEINQQILIMRTGFSPLIRVYFPLIFHHIHNLLFSTLNLLNFFLFFLNTETYILWWIQHIFGTNLRQFTKFFLVDNSLLVHCYLEKVLFQDVFYFYTVGIFCLVQFHYFFGLIRHNVKLHLYLFLLLPFFHDIVQNIINIFRRFLQLILQNDQHFPLSFIQFNTYIDRFVLFYQFLRFFQILFLRIGKLFIYLCLLFYILGFKLYSRFFGQCFDTSFGAMNQLFNIFYFSLLSADVFLQIGVSA